MPAKYLISARVPVTFNGNDSEENLWLIHTKGVEKFLEYFDYGEDQLILNLLNELNIIKFRKFT